MKDDNRNKLSAMVVTGSFIESLYISTGLVKSYPKDLLPTDAKNLILTPLDQGGFGSEEVCVRIGKDAWRC